MYIISMSEGLMLSKSRVVSSVGASTLAAMITIGEMDVSGVPNLLPS